MLLRRRSASGRGRRAGNDRRLIGMAREPAAPRRTGARRQAAAAGAFDAVGAARRLCPSRKRPTRAVRRGRGRFRALRPHPPPGGPAVRPGAGDQSRLGRRCARPRNGRQLSCAVLDTASEEVRVIDFPDPRRDAERSKKTITTSRAGISRITGRRGLWRRADHGRRAGNPRFRPPLRPAADACRQGGGRGRPVRRPDRQRLAHRRADDAAVRRAFLCRAPNLASPGLDELRWLLPVRPGDSLSLRATVLEARRSRSKPDQGVVTSLVEVLNQNGEVVMSLKPISLIRCRPSMGISHEVPLRLGVALLWPAALAHAAAGLGSAETDRRSRSGEIRRRAAAG